MYIRINCGFLQPTRFLSSAAAANILSSSSHYPATVKTYRVVKGNFRLMKQLSFEEFKKKNVKSFEEFKKSPEIIELFENNTEKVKRAYDDYCICKYNRFKIEQHGGNPSTML